MMKFNANCVILKRILEKRLKQHQGELNEIEEMRKNISGSDQVLVQTYMNRLKEMRSGVELRDLDYL